MKTCPRCGKAALKVYYRIFPMWMCPDDECACMWGFWSWVLYFHFDGQITVKEESTVKYSAQSGGAYAEMQDVIELERERIRKREVCSDRSHWSH